MKSTSSITQEVSKTNEPNDNTKTCLVNQEILQSLNLQEKLSTAKMANKPSKSNNGSSNDNAKKSIEIENNVSELERVAKQKEIIDCFINNSLEDAITSTEENVQENRKKSLTSVQNNSNTNETSTSENTQNNPSSSTPNNTIEEFVTPTRKRGRPKKISVKPLAELTEPILTRSKGRPKKDVINDESTNDFNDSVTSDSLTNSNNLLNESLAEDNFESTPRNSSCRSTRSRTIRFVEDTDYEDGSQSDENYKSKAGGRGKGRSRGKGRGRGRGRQRSRRSNCDSDVAYTPDHPVTSEINEYMLIPEVKMETDEPNNTETIGSIIKCGKCKNEVQKTQWYHHNLWKHNNMAWRDEDEPLDFDNNPKLLSKILFDAIKKRQGQLTCELCGVTKKSAKGFESHYTFCGKNEDEKKNLLVTCDICGAIMMPLSMEMHKRIHKRQEQQKNKDADADAGVEEEEEEVIFEKRGRRRAAEKAVSKMSEFTSIIKEEIIIDQKPNVNYLKQLVQKPQLTKRIPGIVKNLWSKEIESNGEAKCRQWGCNFLSKNVEVMIEHYLRCNFTPRNNYECRICKFQTKEEKEIVKHVKEKHPEEEFGEQFSISEQDEDDSNSEEEFDFSDKQPTMFVQPKIRMSAQVRLEKTLRLNRMAFMKNFSHRMRIDSAYEATMKWSLEFQMENYKLELFQDFEPNTFTLLGDAEARLYSPKVEKSMRIAVQSNDQVLKKVSPDWRCWERFTGAMDGNIPTLFCGGPVWSMAWLPIPSPLFSQDVEQFLAVSAHLDMDTEFSIGHSYSGRNVIQLWNIGVLDLEMNNINTPYLSYAIIHEHGTIWSMEWCPSGCYEDERLYNFERSEGRLRRMGLLAAAFSDGNILIYSMVFPEELCMIKREADDFPFYKTKPVRTLVFDRDSFDGNSQNWHCTKLSWTKECEHDIIIAGFSNGYIALWDIATESPFLTIKRPDGSIILDPFQRFFAHSNSVTVINMIPYANKRYCVSASLDRNLKIWDLEDTAHPVSISKYGMVVDGVWLTHWPCAAVAFDNAQGLNASGSYLLPIRDFEYKHFQLLNAGCTIYAIGANDFGNSISEGTVAGDIYAMFPPQLVYLKDIESVFTKTRFLCSSITVVDLESSTGDERINTKDDKKKTKKGEEYRFLPSTYAESKERFGLIFTDEIRYTHRKKGQKISSVDTNHPINVEQYPFTSVNRIVWNPNSWSHLWLAAGYENGLIRLFHFKSLSMPRHLNNLLTEHESAFMKKANDVKLAQFTN